jgi:hypothetical protein
LRKEHIAHHEIEGSDENTTDYGEEIWNKNRESIIKSRELIFENVT